MSAKRGRKGTAKAKGKVRGAPPASSTPAGSGALSRISDRTVLAVFAAAAILAALAFFGSFVFDRDAMIFGTDMVSEAYQSRAFAVQEVRAGRGLPHWNPFVYAGMPFLSTLPYPVWYPTTLLYFVMPLYRAIGWAFVLHLALAGIVTFALARELRLAPGAAAVAGAAYMFTGYIVSHLYAGQDGRMFAMQLAPTLFLFAERAIARRSLHWFGWLAVVVVLQLFSPHVQMMYFSAMAVGAYVVFRLIGMGREERRWKPALTLLAGFAGAYAVAGLVGLIEIWPTLNMVQFSHRAARGYEYAASWAMPVQETLAAIWPGFQGYLESYWGTNPFKLHTEYLGAVPVMLAVLALAARRSARVWFFTGLAAVGLLFAWGAATPVHRLFWWTLPMMQQFRAPAMMYSVVALSVAVLAGHGAQALHDRRDTLAEGRHVAWKALGGGAALWVVLWFWAAGAPESFAGFWSSVLYGPLEAPRRAALERAMPDFVRGLGLFALYWAAGLGVCWATARGRLAPLVGCTLLAVLAVADLWRVDRAFYETIPAARLVEPDPAVRFLQGRPEPFRALPLPDAYNPNDLMLFRVPAVTGSQKFRLAWWDDLVGEQMERIGDTRLWSLLDVRYVVARSADIQLPGLAPVHRGERTVYEWDGPAAGAWLVYRTVVRAEGATGWPEALDPREVALVEPGGGPARLGQAPPGSGAIEWIERNPDRLVLSVDAPADALLVLSEIHHPYWSATVDGAATDVLRVDVALRGVTVPAGRHEVALEFRDPYVTYGAWGSAAGILVLVGFLAATWRRRSAPVAGD